MAKRRAAKISVDNDSRPVAPVMREYRVSELADKVARAAGLPPGLSPDELHRQLRQRDADAKIGAKARLGWERAAAARKAASDPAIVLRNAQIVREYREQKRHSTESASALMEAIGKKHGLRRSHAIKVITLALKKVVR